MSLNSRQLAFIDEYLICLNSSEAARRAGYNGKSNVIGPRLLANVSIKDEINRRLTEKHLSADAVLARLAAMATSNLSDFARIQTAQHLADNRELGIVAKKFKRKITRDALNREHEEIEIELYDAQSALLNIGKQHGLFSDRHIVDIRLEKEVEQILSVLEEMLPSDDYQRILSRLGSGPAGSAETTESDNSER